MRTNRTRRKRGRGFIEDRAGATAIEFGLLAFPFFLLLFGLIETGLTFTAEMLLDRSVEIAAREVKTGEVSQSRMTEDDFRRIVCDTASILLDCDRIRIDLKVYATFDDIPGRPPKDAEGNPDYSDFGFDPGGPDSIVALRAFYDWPLFTDMIRKTMGDRNGNFPLMSVAAFKSESY